MYNTGFHWLGGEDLVDCGSADYYGGTSAWVSSARIADDIAANKLLTLNVEGAKALAMSAFASATATGSGSTTADIVMYGAIGFGEPTQGTWDSNPVFVSRLGTHAVGTVDDSLTALTNQYFDSSTGEQLALTHNDRTYTGYVGGGTQTNDQLSQFTIAVTHALATNTTDISSFDIAGAATGGIAGFGIVSNISIFQKLFFTFEEGSLGTTSVNALISRLY